MTFGAWLKKQAKRDDPVGDLARDVAQDREAPLSMTPRKLRNHMLARHASSLALETLDMAATEWRAASRAESWGYEQTREQSEIARMREEIDHWKRVANEAAAGWHDSAREIRDHPVLKTARAWRIAGRALDATAYMAATQAFLAALDAYVLAEEIAERAER